MKNQCLDFIYVDKFTFI